MKTKMSFIGFMGQHLMNLYGGFAKLGENLDCDWFDSDKTE